MYLKKDVVLIADRFQTFSKTCMDAYKLDPLHYYTAPGLSLDALLKQTKIDLELHTDIDLHLFKDKGVISMVSKRHTKQTILILQIIILRKQITLSCIMMHTTSMVGQ